MRMRMRMRMRLKDLNSKKFPYVYSLCTIRIPWYIVLCGFIDRFTYVCVCVWYSWIHMYLPIPHIGTHIYTPRGKWAPIGHPVGGTCVGTMWIVDCVRFPFLDFRKFLFSPTYRVPWYVLCGIHTFSRFDFSFAQKFHIVPWVPYAV